MKYIFLFGLIFYFITCSWSQCDVKDLTKLRKDPVHGQAIRNLFSGPNGAENRRLWQRWHIHHSGSNNQGNAQVAEKVLEYLPVIRALRNDQKFLLYLPNESQQTIDDIVTRIKGTFPGGSGGDLSQKEVTQRIIDFLDNDQLPGNVNNMKHFFTSFGTSEYYSRHNVAIMQEIEFINQQYDDLIKNASFLDLNKSISNAGNIPGSSVPDMYFISGGQIYIYEKKAGEAFTVESANFITQAGAYIQAAGINNTRFSLDVLTTPEAVVDELHGILTFDQVSIRTKFFEFYDDLFPNTYDINSPPFTSGAELAEFLKTPGNYQWFEKMFNLVY